eukprot:scaffold47840_cov29-Phaeocystis_antarctica.AAC.1
MPRCKGCSNQLTAAEEEDTTLCCDGGARTRPRPPMHPPQLRQAVQEGCGTVVLQHVRLRPLRYLLLGRSDRGGRPRRRCGRRSHPEDRGGGGGGGGGGG